ncbi:MAG: alpha/beta fold hydrolase [Acidobacteriota bacterium]
MKLDNIVNSIETIEMLREDLHSRCKTELYRGTVRVFNALRILTSNGYLTKFERTPAEVVMAERQFILKRFWQDYYASPYTPVLFVPPLMVTPQIYDLRPRHSFVRHLLNYDFDVFVLDFGKPSRRDKGLRLDDYITNIGLAIERIRDLTGAANVTLLGYSMGGIFSNIYTALDRSNSVRNIVALGSPADFSRLPRYHSLAQMIDRPILAIAEVFEGVPASVSRTIFQLMKPLNTVLLPMNLMVNLWDEDYIAGYESMERWFEDFVAYPRDAFKQFFVEIVKQNRLFYGKLEIGGIKVELSKIKSSYLVLAGREDFLGHPDSVRPIMDKIGSKDKTYHEVNGGHLGMLAGKNASSTWNYIAQWLIPRSQLTRQRTRPNGRNGAGKI